MNVKKLKELTCKEGFNKKNIIDVRERYEYKSGNIKGSQNIPMNKLLANPEKFLNKDETYYIICQSGGRSTSTWIGLKLKRYKVKNISGGYNAWKAIKQ